MKDYYLPRWALFIKTLADCVEKKVKFDVNKFNNELVVQEEKWIHSQNLYPIVPSGNTIQISQHLFEKYKSYYN